MKITIKDDDGNVIPIEEARRDAAAPGTILVLRLPQPATEEEARLYRDTARQLGVMLGCQVIGLFPGQELEMLNEERMAAGGWVRKEKR